MTQTTEQPQRLEGVVQKGWGYELIWSTNELYCGKIMVFEKAGNKFSMHFHKEKDESWFVNSGRFLLKYINTKTATEKPRYFCNHKLEIQAPQN